jgi:hypothetical protein
MKILSLTYYVQDPTFSATAIHEHHQSSLASVSTFNPTSSVVGVTSNAPRPVATKVSKTEKAKATLNFLEFHVRKKYWFSAILEKSRLWVMAMVLLCMIQPIL